MSDPTAIDPTASDPTASDSRKLGEELKKNRKAKEKAEKRKQKLGLQKRTVQKDQEVNGIDTSDPEMVPLSGDKFENEVGDKGDGEVQEPNENPEGGEKGKKAREPEPEQANDKTKPPARRVKKGGLFINDDKSDDEEQDRALFSRPGPKPSDNATTVGWTGGRRTNYINMYGKKSAPRYRIKSFASSGSYKNLDEKNVSNLINRKGDKLMNNGKLQYTKRHILGIYGVAWESASSGRHENDLGLMNLDAERKRWPTTYVLIKWDLGEDRHEKTWETRQALRRRWGKVPADKAIYEAARTAEERYTGVTDDRRSASRSPSPLVDDTARQFRDQSLAADELARSQRSFHTPVPTIENPSSERKLALTSARDEFIESYVELSGFESFHEIDLESQTKCVSAWQLRKKQLA